MNAFAKFILMTLLISCVLPVFGQTERSTVKSSKSNGSEKKADEVIVKPGTIHLEMDGAGNSIFYLPSKNPAAIVFNATTNAYEVKAPRDIATGQSSGKRMHKPIKITKDWESSRDNKSQILVCDVNNDCDLSKLEPGNYTICVAEKCFGITLDAQGMIAGYNVKQNNKG